ncbi:MAG: MMPL family transporter [Desulfobacteraceae bacterium]|nr:MMPL family transporter [Desulfobacteraceae bacterium]
MVKLMSRIVNSPIKSSILVLIITFMLIPGFNGLFIDSSSEGLLTKGDPDVEYVKTIKHIFGDAVLHSIIFKSDTIFRTDILQKILDITFDAEGIKGVERVVSMATVSNLKGEGGVLNTDMLLMDVPRSDEEMETLKLDALSNPMFISEVINKTGSVTGVHLFIHNADKETDFDARILKDIQELVQKIQEDLPDDVEIYHIGSPKVKTDIVNAIHSDGIHLTPLAGLAIFVVLFLFFKTGSAVLIPILTGILSIISTIGFMGIMGFGINPVSVIIPTLLFVMGATEDIHLLSEYMNELENGEIKKKAILNMAIKSGTAILLTSLTTLLGFLTIAPNAIPMLREFGIAASFGIGINFVLTILTVPTILKLYKAPNVIKKRENRAIKYFREFLFACVTRYRLFVGIVFIFCIVWSIFGIQKIYIETDYVKFFKEDADVPVLFKKLTADLVGGTNFLVVVESKLPNAFQTPASLSHVGRLQDYLNKTHGKAVGYVDMIRKTHQEMNDGDKAFFRIPDSSDLIAQYNLMMDADNLSRFVNHDFTKTSILVKTQAAGTQEIMAVYDEINQFVRQYLTRDLEYHVTGEMIVVAKASNTITREVIYNLGYMFAAIFLFISLLFLSFKAGALAMIPNMMPVVINFGFMGMMGIPLSTATFPVAIIALGIAVDDTIHFMVRYAAELKKADSNEDAIMNALRFEIRPILSTSTALMAGFSMLLFAQFGSTIQFGKLTALCMLSALISDLLITPLILIKIPIISPVDMLQSYISKKLSYSKCKLLEGLKKGEVRRIIAMGKVRTIETGRQFICQGEPSDNMMLILDGTVDVIKEDTKEVLATLEKGEVVGEMGFVTNEPRSASVITRSPSEVFEIDKKVIQLVANRFPKIGSKLFFNLSQILSQRLKENTYH